MSLLNRMDKLIEGLESAAAIVFPYLRSAISMISSLDSSDAVLIPTVNILSLLEE